MYTLKGYIKFGIKLFHLTWEKGWMENMSWENEEKGEFGSPMNESLCFKGVTPIMLRTSGRFW
jgi:hypothetical protein